MPRLALVLLLFAAPAWTATPSDYILEFVDSHVERDTQMDWYKAFGDLHETVRKSVKKAGKFVRKESKEAEKALLDWSKRNEKDVKKTIRQWAQENR